MDYHPYSEIWPLMEGECFEKLKADIAAKGLRMDIITYQGKILDGRNRERACTAAGITARYTDAGVSSEEAAIDLVVSLNDHRRHMSLEQRAFAAAKLANLKCGGVRGNQYTGGKLAGAILPNSDTTTMREAAEKIGVSRGSTARARAVLQLGTKEDELDVLERKVPLAKKARILTQQKGLRRRAEHSRPKLVSNTVVKSPVYGGNHPKHLTPKEVDPEFCGTALEFAAKYGHVNQHTAEEYATMRFDDLASDMKALAKRCREFPERKAVDSDWLRNPNPRSVAQLTEALDYLRPRITEAEALLERAVAALKEKK